MAKPTPMEPPWPPAVEDSEAIAELMPVACPLMSTSGPPELPGLMAASVWMSLITVSWLVPWPGSCCCCGCRCWSELVRTGRLRAETMPEVTVADRPSGDPTATTPCPIFRSADVPRVAGVSPETPPAVITARSSVGSAPTTVAAAVVPSLNCTFRLVAPSMTWLLVRMRPPTDRMTPDPSPALLDEVDRIDTTVGSRVAATCSTEPPAGTGKVADTGDVVSWVSVWPAGAVDVPAVNRAPNTPPPNPATSAKATVAAAISVLRGPRCADREFSASATGRPTEAPAGKGGAPGGAAEE